MLGNAFSISCDASSRLVEVSDFFVNDFDLLKTRIDGTERSGGSSSSGVQTCGICCPRNYTWCNSNQCLPRRRGIDQPLLD